jgi:hypothetical protein
MLKTVAAVLLAVPLFMMAVVAGTGCLLVDVRTDEGPRIVVPVPLLMARAALAFAPEEAVRVEVPELEEHHEMVLDVLEELRDAPDGVLVEVDDDADHVLIEKRGDYIEVFVHDGDDNVEVSVPIATVVESLESFDGERIDVSAVLKSLARASRTDLVHVRTAEEEIKISLW